MKILLFGRNGQIGWELSRSLLPLGELIALDYPETDFSKPESLSKIVGGIMPDVIVNAAAYTAVDQAEKEEDIATRVNGYSPAILADEANKLGALLVHYSTDYVFDGEKNGAYTEEDIPNPLSAYGRSKLKGDIAIQTSGTNHLIFRTSWVFASRGKNFVRTILNLITENEELRIVADQTGSPTCARLIADTTAHAIRQSYNERLLGKFKSGLYNLTASGETSWHEFAMEIVKVKQLFEIQPASIIKKIVPISTVEYPTPAQRPLNSRLSNQKIQKTFGIHMPAWNACLNNVLAEMNAGMLKKGIN